MPKPVIATRFTHAVVSNFIGRKGPALISFFCDTIAGKVILVPQGYEHIDWAAEILRTDRDELQKNPAFASHLIPVVIDLDPMHDEVRSGVIGTSGMEIAYGVRHTKGQLDRAEQIATAFIVTGELRVSPSFRFTIVRKWQT